MKFLQLWKPVLAALATICVLFVMAAIFDIIVAVVNSRFYSNAAFIVIFGITGVFAAMLAYSYGKGLYRGEDKGTVWALIITNIIAALVFFFLLAGMESGEYGWACKSFGIAVAVTTLFLAKGKLLD